MGTHISGPKGFPFVGSALELRKDPLGCFERWSKQFGTVCSFQLGGSPSFLVTDSRLIEELFVKQKKLWHRSSFAERFVPLLGRGLLTAKEENWRPQRLAVQPAFSNTKVNSLAPQMEEEAQRLVAEWEEYAETGAAVDIEKEMSKYTLRVIARTMFRAVTDSETEEIYARMSFLGDVTGKRFWSLNPFVEKMPTIENMRYRTHIAQLKLLLDKKVKENSFSDVEVNQLLSYLRHSKGEVGGETLSDQELFDNVVTVFLAGHETTAHSLSWTWYLLHEYPGWAERMDEDGVAKAAILESLRLYSPSWTLTRVAVEDTSLGGVSIKKGSMVFMPQWIMHRHPDHWENPTRFDPQRFLGDQRRRHSGSFFPFGLGEHICVGAGLSMLESEILLKTVTKTFHVEILEPKKVKALPLVVLRPNHLHARLTKRR